MTKKKLSFKTCSISEPGNVLCPIEIIKNGKVF